MKVADLARKAEDSLASAQLLLAKGYVNDAVDRAYYAMFNFARAALLSCEYEVDVHKSHKGVINAFSHRLVKEGIVPQEFGSSLREAGNACIMADYREDSIDSDVARDIVEQAQKFVTAMREIVSRRNTEQGHGEQGDDEQETDLPPM